MIHNKKRTIFLTGATGLIGSYLLKIFLENGHKVYALARDKERRTAVERVKEVLDFWNGSKNPAKNLVVVKGDITEPDLGLSLDEADELRNEVEEVFHCAAIVNLKWPLAKIRQINVKGAEHIFYFSSECKKLIKVNHVSTAYIYGSHTGVFKETDLDVSQEFNTTYERSKFEAEKVVRAYRKKGLWVDIFRPPIVVGHSQSGKILRFINIYQLIYLCSLGIFKVLPVSGFYVRLIPVDSVCQAMYIISQKTEEKNRNYHPFLNTQVAAEDIVSCGCKLIGIPKPRAVSLRDFDLQKLTAAQMAILQNNILSVNLKNKLSSDYTIRVLKSHGFSFPEFDQALLERILGYFIEMKHLNKGGGK